MKALKLFTIVVMVSAFVATGVWAQNQKPVAEVMVGSYGLSWSPNVSYAKLVLTVSTPGGQVFTRTFDAGSVPGFDLSDLEPPVLDGSYTYELRVIPVMPAANLRRGEKLGMDKKFTGTEPMTQSGHFHVKHGGIVNPNLSENPSGTADQVINDDLIVSFSACIGNDCVNGESFGFDTLRLKENNLRIKFQDTSNSASFPSNDWQITANDSSNGGANKFSIDDIDGGRTPFTLEAGAPSHSLYVDDGGRLGLGTSTPVVDVHVVSGNTPTLRLEQNGSSGFTPQTWDVAGNEANFFVRDATNGSKLPFKIKPGAPTNSIFVDADGDVGFGSQSPGTNKMLVTKSGTAATLMVERSDTSVQTIVKSTGTNGIIGTFTAHDLIFNVANAPKMTLDSDGNLTMTGGGVGGAGFYDSSTGQWTDGSSRALKENIKDLDVKEAMAAFKKLNPVTFKMKVAPKGAKQVGFIAEDVPELVAKRNRKGLAPMDIVAVLTKVVQEQQKTIEELKKEIKEIKK